MISRKSIFGGILVGAAALAVAASLDAESSLTKFVQKLNAAEGLHATYSVTEIGKAPQNYSVRLAKPNLAHIVTPNEIIVADGESVTYYNKRDNSYFVKPQSKAELAGLLGETELALWSGFFNGTAFSNVAKVEDLGQKERRGTTFDVVKVTMDAEGATSYTLYIDKADGLAKQAQLDATANRKTITQVLNANSVVLKGLGADVFAFNAPAGSKEINLADLKASTWSHDIGEALELAKATGKPVMIDFMASWCGPCKMMDRDVFQTDTFKELSSKLVLCKIDGDLQPDMMKKYGVSAYPTVVFLSPEGKELHRYVGYRDLNGFLGEAGRILN